MNLLLRWLVSALAIMITAYIIKGVSVESYVTALWLSVFLGFVNVIIRPVLVFLTLPINIVTLGLFIFVINAGLVLLATSAIKGFVVDSFFIAMLFSIVLSIFSFFLHRLFGTKGKKNN